MISTPMPRTKSLSKLAHFKLMSCARHPRRARESVMSKSMGGQADTVGEVLSVKGSSAVVADGIVDAVEAIIPIFGMGSAGERDPEINTNAKVISIIMRACWLSL